MWLNLNRIASCVMIHCERFGFLLQQDQQLPRPPPGLHLACEISYQIALVLNCGWRQRVVESLARHHGREKKKRDEDLAKCNSCVRMILSKKRFQDSDTLAYHHLARQWGRRLCCLRIPKEHRAKYINILPLCVSASLTSQLNSLPGKCQNGQQFLVKKPLFISFHNNL